MNTDWGGPTTQACIQYRPTSLCCPLGTVATDMGIRQNWAPDGLHRYKDCNSLYSHKHCTGLCSSPCLPPSPYWPDNKSARTVQLFLSRKESRDSKRRGVLRRRDCQSRVPNCLTGRWASSYSSRILPTKASELKCSSHRPSSWLPQLGSNRSPRYKLHRS